MNAVNSDWKHFILALEAAPKQTKVLRRLSEQRTHTHIDRACSSWHVFTVHLLYSETLAYGLCVEAMEQEKGEYIHMNIA